MKHAVATRAARPAVADTKGPESRSQSSGSPAGAPLFLCTSATCGAPQVQSKCTCGTGTPCTACANDDEGVQRKEDGGGGEPHAAIRSVASHGVEGAGDPLPHHDRIQRAFGRHDVSGVKTRTGGRATDANEAMGSVGYTVGDRIGFRSSPDVRLAAHEATHVLHQRSGVQLADGVGHPGDPYEQEADAVADAVERGESAEPILDRGPAGNAQRTATEEEPVQHQLSVSATRLFEPEVVSEAVGGGGARPTPAGGGGEGEGAEEAAEGEEGGEDPQAAEEETAPPADEAAVEPEADEGGEGGGAPGGGEATTATGTCSGGGVAQCYDAPSDQPAQEPEEQPPNPEPGDVQEESSDEGEEDAPEPDDCPPQTEAAAEAGVPGGGAPAAAPGGPAAEGGAAPAAEGAASPEAAPAEGGGGEGAAASAPDGGGAPESGGGGGGEGAATSAHSSPLEGPIADGEAQRGAAVAAYEASSGSLDSAADGTRTLRAGVDFGVDIGEGTQAVMWRDAATTRLNGFFSGAADQLDAAIAFATNQAPVQLGSQADAAKSELAASIEGQKAIISGRIDVARGQARADAAMARREVLAQADAFVADVEEQTTTAIEALTETHGDAMGQVDELETSTLEAINQLYADGRTDLEGLGTAVGDEATATGEEFANTYKGFRHCTENGFWDGDLSERRSIAQEKAARETAKGYHDRIVESARKRAREITRAGRKKDRCAVIAAATGARDALDQQLTAVVDALERARESTIQQAGRTRDSLIASIDDSLAATLRQLDQQEHDQRQAANDTGYLQQVLQEQIAYAGAAALQRVVADASAAVQSALFQLQAQIGANSPPAPGVLDGPLADVGQRLSASLDGLQTGVEGGAAVAGEQLAAAAQQGLAALDAVSATNDELTATVSGGFAASMSQIAGTDNFAAQRTAFTQLVQQSAAAGSAALMQAVDAMSQGCDATLAEAEATLAQAHIDLEQNLRQSEQGIECDITSKADEAASKEPPAWKMLVAILLVIIVLVIVIAVIVFTGGTALAGLGPLATVLAGAAIGAVVGAVTSGLLAIAGDLWSNRALSASRIGRAMLIGAITGAIGGGIGAGVGLALKGFSLVVQYGAAMALAGGLDVVTQFVLGGLSFDSFSWANLGLTLLITALTLGLAHAVHAPRAGAPTGEGGAPPGAATPEELGPVAAPHEEGAPVVAPHDEVPSVSAPPEDVAPLSAPHEEGAPVPAPHEEVPTVAPAEEPAPIATPEETAPPTAPAEEPAPVSAPEETAPPTSPTEEGPPAAPGAEEPTPTTKPAEEGQPSTGNTPDEAPTEQLPPDEVPEPTTDPDGEIPPWQQGRNPSRYQRYVRNLQRRSPGKEPLGPEEWWARHGSKAPNNPAGGEGNQAHRDVVGELQNRARQEFPDTSRYRLQTNRPVAGTNRKPDVAVIDTTTGRVVKVYEAARFNKSGGLVRPDERAKIPDYEAAGIPYEFHPVGPNKPPGGVLRSPPPPATPTSPTTPPTPTE